MKHFLLFLSFGLSLSVHAQKKVSEICADKIPLYDSAMKIQFGSAIYPYFKIDTLSSVITADRRIKFWNDTMHGDSIRYFDLRFNLEFPGAKRSSFGYYPERANNGLPLDKSKSYPLYCSSIVDSTTMDMITKKYMRRKLKECEVSPCPFENLSDIKPPKGMKLDETHIYLNIDYIRKTTKTKGIYVALEEHYKYIIVDACTGRLISKPHKFRIVEVSPSK